MTGRPIARIRPSVVISALLVILAGRGVAAQERGDGSPGTIRGLAFDSTHMSPLAGALVSLAGGEGLLRTDSAGEFRLEEVPPGQYSIVVAHPRLDSLGLTPILRSLTVESGGRYDVLFSTPSLAYFQQLYCDAEGEPGLEQGAIVIGAVQDQLTGVGQPRVDIVAEWLEPGGARRASATTTDGAGVFGFCDLPREIPIRMVVYAYGDTEDETVINLNGQAILLHDVMVHLTSPAVMVGEILDQDTGEPIEAAIVRIQGTGLEATTGARGRFRFPEVPPGRHVLEMEHLAYGTQSRAVDVGTRTLDVTARFSREAIELEGITVISHPARLERMGYFQRREMRAGFASFIEREEIVKRSPLRLSTALSSETGIIVRHGASGPYLVSGRGGSGIDQVDCRLRMIVDGMEMSGVGWNLDSFPPNQIQAIEIYPTDLSLPQRFRNSGAAMTGCGAIVIWTGG